MYYKKIIAFLFIFSIFFGCKSSTVVNPLEELPFDCSGLPNPEEICNTQKIPDGENVVADIELSECGTLSQMEPHIC